MFKNLARSVVHIVTNTRKYQYKKVAKFAEGKKNKKILELGSGPLVKGKYFFSTKHLFDASNDFTQSDIVKSFGHPIIDVTKMKYKSEFDVILCISVLEHVYDYETAIKNIHTALKKGGTAIIATPMFYPLHDEPGDYWRFTEHAHRKLFKDFEIKQLKRNGPRIAPFSYYMELKKK